MFFPKEETMKIPIEFVSQGYKIQGKFYSASGKPPFPTVLLLHGLPGNVDDVLGLGLTLSQNGINTVSFNYRGTYQSEGIYSLRNTFEDIQAALEYLHREEIVREFKIDTSRQVLGGYSFGGGMAMAYAIRHPDIKRIVSIAGTDHGEFAREYLQIPTFKQMIDTMFDELMFPEGPVHFQGKEAVQELLQNPDLYDLKPGAPALADRDIFLIGGCNDPYVTIEGHILPLYRILGIAGARQVRLVAFQDDHAFEKSKADLAQAIVNWV
jgi:pimeloyl-ACP methyl ester carboxylesterase